VREAVLYLTGFAQRDMYGASYRVKSEITIADLMARTQHVVGHEVEVIRNQLMRNHVDILGGTAQFEDPHTVTVHGAARGDHNTVTADKIVIATGTRPARPPEVEFDDEEYHVVDSDAVVRLERVPTSMVVVGAGSGTSTPSGTSSASPPWPRRAWTRAGSPPTTRSTNRPGSCTVCSRSHLHRPRDLLLREDRGGADGLLHPVRGGMSRYRELARGAIVGDSYGMLKLLVSTEDRTLLGVHVFGTNATDLVHIGQAIMGCGGTVDYLVDTVLNYPTLSEAYKVAALDVTNKIRALQAYS
jgi:pyruvate/2-oxoglutarate dehydrogenase complex dihydrolipoamide dehydrogenase (E3) component